MSKLKAVAYARFSSDRQRVESIDAQLRAIHKFAEDKGIPIVDEYIDKAQSARSDDRIAFQQMIEDIDKGKFNVIIVHKSDRFARNKVDASAYRALFRQKKIVLMSVTEPMLTDSPASVLFESIIDGVNEYYSMNLALEVEKGKRENALKGMSTGGRPPLGYDLDTKTKMLVINECEAQAVRLIFDMRADGYCYGAIRDALNSKGFKTKEGNSFGKNSLYSILRNEKYTGVYVYNLRSSKNADGTFNSHSYKEESEIIRTEGAVPQIITPELFNTVQELMDERRQTQGKDTIKYQYLLTGKVRCGICGSTFSARTRKPRKGHGGSSAYICQKKNHSVKCSNSEIKCQAIEAFVLETLADFIFDEEKIPLILSRYQEYLEEKDSGKAESLKRMKKELSSLDRQIENIVSVIANTGSDALLSKLKSLESAKATLEYKYNELNEVKDKYTIEEQILKDSFYRAKTLFRDGKLKFTKTIISRYLKEVMVYPDRLEVYLNFGMNDVKFEKPITDKDKEKTPEIESPESRPTDDGRGDRTRTCGILLPKQAL